MTQIHHLFSDGLESVQHTLCMPKSIIEEVDPIAALSGKRIRGGREAKGWTQEELARRTGWSPDRPSRAQKSSLSQSRIANFEQGTRRVGLEEAQILAAVLDQPAPYFMGVISEREAAVLSALRNNLDDPFPGTPAASAVRAKRA